MNQTYPGAYPPSAPPRQKKKTSPWLTCGIIAATLMCVGTIATVLGFGGLVAVFGSEPQGLQLEVNSPGSVNLGEEFDLQVTLRNTGSKEFTVTEIQLPATLLTGTTPLKIDPPDAGQMDYGSSTGYKYTLILAPGETSRVTFHFVSLLGGDYEGEVTAIVGTKRKSTNLRVLVRDGQTAPPAANVQLTPSSAGPLNAPVPFQAVVEIQAMINHEGQMIEGWWGSGTIISPNGLILTNAHVVSSTKTFDVIDLVVAMTIQPDQSPEPRYYARVLQVDQSLDIAVIQVETDLNGNPVDASLNLPYVPLGNSDTLELNDELIILGYPGIGGQTITLTDGRVGGFTAEQGYGKRAFIKTSATIAGGNSGGLAANEKGEIIGIPTQLGYGGDDQYADCRRLVDTNDDGFVDETDTCIPTGGFINALRPINLAMPYIDAAKRGEVNIIVGAASNEEYMPSGSIILQDDFSNPNSGWFTGTDELGYTEYVNGEYWFQVLPENRIVWVMLGEDLRDVEISVEGRPEESTGDGSYGVLCRYQDQNNFYGLEVSEDGYFTIWRRDDGEYVFLNYWQYSEIIPQFQPLKLTASCRGDRLSLAVNDMLLAEVVDDTFQSGDIGLFVETYEKGGLLIAFDNFAAYQ